MFGVGLIGRMGIVAPGGGGAPANDFLFLDGSDFLFLDGTDFLFLG